LTLRMNSQAQVSRDLWLIIEAPSDAPHRAPPSSAKQSLRDLAPHEREAPRRSVGKQISGQDDEVELIQRPCSTWSQRPYPEVLTTSREPPWWMARQPTTRWSGPEFWPCHVRGNRARGCGLATARLDCNAGNTTLTTVSSMNAMFEPRIVAASSTAGKERTSEGTDRNRRIVNMRA